MTVIAQIGCGYWGPNLLRNFHANPDCSVKFVAEASANRREYVKTHFPGIAVTDNWQEILADTEIEGVVIATPASSHFEITKAALESGKHALVEKPLSTNVQDAAELAELAQANSLVLMAGHTFLYNGAVRHFRGLMESGDLGHPYYLYAQRLNLGQVRSDINVWWNLAPHDISILLYLMGDELPEGVSATGIDYLQKGVEDVVFAQLVWPNRVSANIHVSWLDPGKVRKVTLVASRKMVVYDDMAEHKISVLDKGFDVVPRSGDAMEYDESAHGELVSRSGDVVFPKIKMPEPLAVEAAHFLDCIRTGAVPLSGPEHAKKVVAVLEAGQRSLAQNRQIMGVPEKVSDS